MRLFSEELRAGTIESVLTAPVRESTIVAGKYLAAVCFLLSERDEVKFVVKDRADYEFARDVIRRHDLSVRVGSAGVRCPPDCHARGV